MFVSPDELDVSYFRDFASARSLKKTFAGLSDSENIQTLRTYLQIEIEIELRCEYCFQSSSLW